MHPSCKLAHNTCKTLHWSYRHFSFFLDCLKKNCLKLFCFLKLSIKTWFREFNEARLSKFLMEQFWHDHDCIQDWRSVEWNEMVNFELVNLIISDCTAKSSVKYDITDLLLQGNMADILINVWHVCNVNLISWGFIETWLVDKPKLIISSLFRV